MPVDPTSSTNRTTPTAISNRRSDDPSILGKDDFLKLLIGQMKNQDPLNPTDGAEYMGQMTQFSILEQITNVGQTMQAASSNEYDQNAIGLIGKEITYLRLEGSELRTYSGRVESVTFSNLGPRLKVTGERDPVLPVSILNVWGADGPPRVEEPRPEDPGTGETPATGGAEAP